MKGRKARPTDVAVIHRLVAHYSAQGLLLPRTPEEIHAHIERFLVLEEKTQLGKRRILGCVALESYGSDLAEIRSLAVNPGIRGRGVGARLLRYVLAVAKRRRITRVFAVTHAPAFFGRQGFVATTRRALPEKIARDCRTCPKKRHCELVAVVATVCPERAALAVIQPTWKPAPVA